MTDPGHAPVTRTPLFTAQHSERYARQDLVRRYQELTGANLIVMIDQIFPDNMTYLEELLHPLDSATPLHLLLASPGGDGETAIRIVRSLQARCTELTVVLPDMAKSAATILCLGADRIVFGPGGDLGPVDSQMRYPNGTLASAKELVEAVDEAEKRITATTRDDGSVRCRMVDRTTPYGHVNSSNRNRRHGCAATRDLTSVAGRHLAQITCRAWANAPSCPRLSPRRPRKAGRPLEDRSKGRGHSS